MEWSQSDIEDNLYMYFDTQFYTSQYSINNFLT